MSERPADLPDYRNPPVAEVVFGLNYACDEPFLAPHIGLYWQLIKEDFPDIQHHPPLDPQVEDLSREVRESGRTVQIISGAPPLPRCWFVDTAGNTLIQLQPDRFIGNWRKITGDEAYPRFEKLRDAFLSRWLQFGTFAEGIGLGSPIIKQAELTYVNHIPQGTCWQEMSDVSKVISPLDGLGRTRFLQHLESLQCFLHYRLPDDSGRLHVAIDPVVRRDGDETQIVLRVKLTARGPVAGETEDAVKDWFTLAREWIVRGFTDLTSDEAHAEWERVT